MTRDKETAKYVSDRLSHGRDDRSDFSKKMRDAELRGSLGCREANRIIKMIDTHKSLR